MAIVAKHQLIATYQVMGKIRFPYWLAMLWLILLASAAKAAPISQTVLNAIDEGRWSIAASALDGGGVLQSYILWRSLLDAQSDASFPILRSFINQHPNWPKIDTLRVRAEKALFQSNSRSDDARAWLKRFQPISGYGMLAEDRIEGRDHNRVRKAWIQGDFDASDEKIILKEFGASLDKSTHRARSERLLKQQHPNAAERMLPLVADDDAALFRARIALQRDERHVDGKIARIPDKLKQDHGLLAERAIWRHNHGLSEGMRGLLAQMDPASPYADRLWHLRAITIRDAIEAGEYDAAAKFLANAGNKLRRVQQADRLWLKGWLELVFRGNPDAAYEAFNTLFHYVSYPVSKARGAYWTALAANAKGEKKLATAWLARAAKHPTAFYGQLGYSALFPDKPLQLPKPPVADQAALGRFAEHPFMQLVSMFHQAGAYRLGTPFLQALLRAANTAGDYAALAQLFAQRGMWFAQVKTAKEALKKHIFLAEGWPHIPLPKNIPLEPALSLAIARQESEFNPQAVSRANARGLMQLLPSTARKVARQLEMDYRLDALFDPATNLQLGSHYLHDLLSRFDRQAILAIAGYNAGPNRSRQWVERFGKPGSNLARTLKFMELIPFGETRNYVQRVMENWQLYRALLQPGSPLTIEQELLR